MSRAVETTQSMQRVKVGMTGLAFVLLLIGLASAIFSSASKEPQRAVVGAPSTEAVTSMTTVDTALEPPKEPLAELGVTPSTETEPDNSATPAKPGPSK